MPFPVRGAGGLSWTGLGIAGTAALHHLLGAAELQLIAHDSQLGGSSSLQPSCFFFFFLYNSYRKNQKHSWSRSEIFFLPLFNVATLIHESSSTALSYCVYSASTLAWGGKPMYWSWWIQTLFLESFYGTFSGCLCKCVPHCLSASSWTLCHAVGLGTCWAPWVPGCVLWEQQSQITAAQRGPRPARSVCWNLAAFWTDAWIVPQSQHKQWGSDLDVALSTQLLNLTLFQLLQNWQ